MKHLVFLIIQLIVVSLLSACGGGGSSPDPTKEKANVLPTIADVQVTPENSTTPKFTTQQYSALAIYSDGTTADITSQIAWESSDISIAVFSTKSGEEGLISALNEGSVTISENSSGSSWSTQFTVSPPKLLNISVTPSSNSVALGETTQMTATGTFQGGVTQDITDNAVWGSLNAALAAVTTSGTVTSIGVGHTAISAKLDGVTGSAQITILPATLVDIQISPSVASVEDGKSLLFNATGTYTDANSQDVTTLVNWESSSVAIASISNDAGSQGRAIGLSPGNTLVSASLGSVTAQVSLDVLANPNGAGDISITATPNVILSDGLDSSVISVTVIPNDTINGVIPDGTTVDFSTIGQATLSSASDFTLSEVASSSLTSTVAQGVVPVAVSVRDTAVEGGVNIAVVSSFSDAFASTGTSGGVIINGYYQSGSTFDVAITNSSNRTFDLSQFTFTNGGVVLVSTSDPSVLSGNDVTGGETIGITVTLNTDQFDNGFAGIFYLNDPVTGNSFSVSYGDTSTLTSIELVDAIASKRSCDIYQLTAIGHYLDGSTQDISSQVSWVSTDRAVASIDNSGRMITHAPGGTTITASSGGISSAISAVVLDTLTSLTVVPTSRSIAMGLTKQFIATAEYSDLSTADVTAMVIWSSSNADIATISNTGVATSVGEGITTIAGSCGAISGSTQLTVIAVELVSLAIEQGFSATIRDGESLQLSVAGIYSDGTTAVMTNLVVWSIPFFDLDVATVSSTGLVQTVGPGVAQVHAAVGSIDEVIFITVQ